MCGRRSGQLGQPAGTLQVLLGTIAKRRLKSTMVAGKPLIELPPKTVELVHVDLTGEHRRQYVAWETAGRRIISQHLAADQLLRNYTSVLEIILRLRQICDAAEMCAAEPPVATHAAGGREGPSGGATALALSAEQRQELVLKLVGLLASGAMEECPICMDDVTNAVITACGHVFCRSCVEHWLMNEDAKCPLCRGPVSAATLVDAPPEAAAAPLEGTGDAVVRMPCCGELNVRAS